MNDDPLVGSGMDMTALALHVGQKNVVSRGAAHASGHPGIFLRAW